MANVKISQLPAASTITAGSDVLPIVHDGVTQKATPNQIVKKVLEAPGAIGGTTPSTGAFSAVNTGDLTTTGTVSLNGYITTDATAAFFDQPRIYDYADTHTYRLRGVSPGLAADVFCFLPVLGGNDTFVFQGHTQTLTNKTISGSSNTLSNIGNASLTNSSITINETPVSLGGSISIGSGIPYPGAGIAVSTDSAWGTSKNVPSGDLVGTTDAQVLSGKTFTSPTINGGSATSLTTLSVGTGGSVSFPFLNIDTTALFLRNPRIYDTLENNWYRITPSELTDNRYITLPALGADDTFVFQGHSQTLTNKTLTTPVINGFTGDTSVVNIGSGQIYKDVSGNVGIGTSSPYAKATLYNASSNYQLLLKGGSAGVAGDGGGIAFSTAALSAITSPDAAAAAVRSLNTFASESNGEQGDLAFYTNRRTGTNTYTGLTERLRINSSGGVAFTGSYGSAGQVLTSNGSSAAPTWGVAGGSMYVTVAGFTTADINNAISSAGEGGTIFLPAGTYSITSTITLKDINVLGVGAKTILQGSSVAAPTGLGATNPMFILTGIVTIKNVFAKFDVKPTSASAGQYVIFRCGDGSYPLQRYSNIDSIFTSDCGTAFYSPTGAGSVFSTTFSNLRVENFRYRGFDIRGSDRTGNVYSNIYFGNIAFTTSTNSFTVSTGSKTFTTATSTANFTVNDIVTIASQANSLNAMYGTLTSKSTNSLTVNVTSVIGSGSFSAWNIATRSTCDAVFALSGNESECVISQINPEHSIFTTAAMILDGVNAASINALHFEQISPASNNIPFLYTNASSGTINSLTVLGNYYPAYLEPTTTGNSIVQCNSAYNTYGGTNNTLTANYFNVGEFYVANIPTTTSWKMFARGTNNGPMYIEVGGYQYTPSNSFYSAFPTSGNLTFINSGVNSYDDNPIRNIHGGVNLTGYSSITNTDFTAYNGAITTTQRSTDGSHYIFNSTTGTLAGQIYTVGAATTFAPSSDYRLKSDIEEISDPIGKLMALQPKRFLMEGMPYKIDGFLAHEVQSVMPEAVIGEKDAIDEDGNPIYQCMDATKFIPSMVATIKQLIARIEALEAP